MFAVSFPFKECRGAERAEEQPWSQLHDLLDERWFIDVDLEEAMGRVKARQVGNGAPVEVAEKRVATNDRPNAELILGSRHRADVLVPSISFAK